MLDVGSIDPCDHEEADTCLILRCYHSVENGSRKIVIRTTCIDNDVVLEVASFHYLNLEELFIHCSGMC